MKHSELEELYTILKKLQYSPLNILENSNVLFYLEICDRLIFYYYFIINYIQCFLRNLGLLFARCFHYYEGIYKFIKTLLIAQKY